MKKPVPTRAASINESDTAPDANSTSTAVRLPINQIARDAKFQVRNKLNEATVKRYENNYRSGREMPPVKVALVNNVPILVDGWHRLRALENLGKAHVEAEVQKASRREALWMAASANLDHGLPLKSGELRAVFRAYIRANRHVLPKGNLKSYREIAADLGKPHGTIYNWMKKDFPRVADQLSGDEGGIGGLPEEPLEAASAHVAAARVAMAKLTAAFSGTSDADERGTIIDELDAALSQMRGSGNWNAPDY